MNLFPKASSLTSEVFGELWSSKVVNPLVNLGFKESGKSLFIEQNESVLALVRLGGRMARPGAICHTFCFRHKFLRNLKEEIPKKFEREVFAYPIKSKPSKLSAIGKTAWHYTPLNRNYPREYVDFAKSKKSKIISELQKLHELMLQSIREGGGGAWVENLWLEDYENHPTNKFSER